MSMQKDYQQYVEKIKDLSINYSDFHPEAYNFVMAGLNYTVSKLNNPRHISGQELSVGMKDFAIEQFGPMAITVLGYWGIKETFDFGKIVYRLIDVQMMSRSPADKITDFRNVYSFHECFVDQFDYLSEIKKTAHVD